MTDTNIARRLCPYCLLIKPADTFRITAAGFRQFVRCVECDVAMGHPLSPSQAQVAYGPICRRVCADCGQAKSAVEFHRNLKRIWGIDTYCKKCTNAHMMRYLGTDAGRQKRRAHDRKATVQAKHAARRRVERERLRNIKNAEAPERYVPQGTRARTLWRKYKMTVEQYDRILLSQGGVCAICGGRPSEQRSLCVDHNHTTYEIRGLLCIPCNAGIGNFKECLDLLDSANRYLRRYNHKEKAA